MKTDPDNTIIEDVSFRTLSKRAIDKISNFFWKSK